MEAAGVFTVSEGDSSVPRLMVAAGLGAAIAAGRVPGHPGSHRSLRAMPPARPPARAGPRHPAALATTPQAASPGCGHAHRVRSVLRMRDSPRADGSAQGGAGGSISAASELRLTVCKASLRRLATRQPSELTLLTMSRRHN
jgi:hypothetical protein